MNRLVSGIRNVDNQTVICIEGYTSSIINYNDAIDETTYVANDILILLSLSIFILHLYRILLTIFIITKCRKKCNTF